MKRRVTVLFVIRTTKVLQSIFQAIQDSLYHDQDFPIKFPSSVTKEHAMSAVGLTTTMTTIKFPTLGFCNMIPLSSSNARGFDTNMSRPSIGYVLFLYYATITKDVDLKLQLFYEDVKASHFNLEQMEVKEGSYKFDLVKQNNSDLGDPRKFTFVTFHFIILSNTNNLS